MDRVVHTLPPKNKVSTPLVSYYVLRCGFRLGLQDEICQHCTRVFMDKFQHYDIYLMNSRLGKIYTWFRGLVIVNNYYKNNL